MIGPFTLKPFTPEASENRELLFSYVFIPNGIKLRFQIQDSNHNLVWPKKCESTRAYELWKTTCFELFLAEKNCSEYIELNFSPSTKWDAYEFTSYRQPQPPKRFEDIQVNFITSEHGLVEVDVFMDLKEFEANATAVIEDRHGIHYFAYKHASEKPDFHQRSNLIINLNNL